MTDAAGQVVFAEPQVTNQTVTVDLSTVTNVDCSMAPVVTENVLVPAAGPVSAAISGDWCTAFPIPTGTIAGTISSSYDASPIQGVVVTAEPNVGTPVTGAPSSAAGVYSIAGVEATDPNGGLTVNMATLPSNCQDPLNAGPHPYSGLTDGGTLTVDLNLICTAPPQGYEFATTWDNQNPTVGTQVVLSFDLDMTTYDDPGTTNDDNDDVGAFDFVFTYDAGVLSAVSCTGGSFTNISNTGTAGTVVHTGFTTNPSSTNPQNLGSCTFDVIGTGPSVQVFTWNALAGGAGGALDVGNVLHSVNQSVTGN
jgi:hypothetical protein